MIDKRVVDRMALDAVIFGKIIVVPQPFEDGSFPQFAVQRMNVHFFSDRKCVKHGNQPPVMRFRISFAKVITTPPARVIKPFALCDGSWDLRDRPICTIPKPKRNNPVGRNSPKMKSDRLLIT